MINATELTANPQAHRTGWKNVRQQATTVACGGARGSGCGGRGGGGTRSAARGRGRSLGGSGRGRGVFADAFRGFSAATAS
eukprot:1909388-Pleurochrysis_carterae.AAC.1